MSAKIPINVLIKRTFENGVPIGVRLNQTLDNIKVSPFGGARVKTGFGKPIRYKIYSVSLVQCFSHFPAVRCAQLQPRRPEARPVCVRVCMCECVCDCVCVIALCQGQGRAAGPRLSGASAHLGKFRLNSSTFLNTQLIETLTNSNPPARPQMGRESCQQRDSPLLLYIPTVQ